ncbi:MAG: SMP-30/gluconolactonase/LRE family protein [Candidatus Dormibacteraeota bacterium]|nr:SMP-30/gluconolactonase/LRE family protein [Candidatus Dormibacteraeota bacterium]
MAVQVNSPGMEELVDPAAQLIQVADGFLFTEGPVWNAAEQALYFSDIPGDARYRWSEAGGVQVVMRPDFKANGLVYDAQGRLIACEHVSSSVARFDRDGRREVLAFHHQGKYLNSPNDVVTRSSDGAIYFTDPGYGRMNSRMGSQRESELGFQGVYRIPAEGGGEAELLVAEDEFDSPNGLCFSPDERILYVDDTRRREVKAFDVAADGSLSRPRVLLGGIGSGEGARGAPDGMKCDEQGNVWVTGPGGVWVISPQGEHLGVIETPESTANLAWGGPGWHSLFFTSSTAVHRLETKVGAAPLPYHRR